MFSFVPAGLRAPLALAVVWLSFGSAFVATRIGVHGAPPLLFAGFRFVIAGPLLLAWCAWREGGIRVTRRELLEGVAVGATMILCGQGAVTLVATEVGPGVLAVLTSTVPLWTAMLAFLVFRRRVSPLAWGGVVLGFGGVVLLASPSGAGLRLLPTAMVTGGAIAWAAGTLIASRSHLGRRPLLLAAIQMSSGGVLQLVLGGLTGEFGQLHIGSLFPNTVLAFAYLVVVAALIGFPLFTWLATSVDAGLANSQAYVAPVVAMLLGWVVLGDASGPRAIVAAAISLAGVALMVITQARAARVRPEPSELPEAA